MSPPTPFPKSLRALVFALREIVVQREEDVKGWPAVSLNLASHRVTLPGPATASARIGRRGCDSARAARPHTEGRRRRALRATDTSRAAADGAGRDVGGPGRAWRERAPLAGRRRRALCRTVEKGAGAAAVVCVRAKRGRTLRKKEDLGGHPHAQTEIVGGRVAEEKKSERMGRGRTTRGERKERVKVKINKYK